MARLNPTIKIGFTRATTIVIIFHIPYKDSIKFGAVKYRVWITYPSKEGAEVPSIFCSCGLSGGTLPPCFKEDVKSFTSSAAEIAFQNEPLSGGFNSQTDSSSTKIALHGITLCPLKVAKVGLRVYFNAQYVEQKCCSTCPSNITGASITSSPQLGPSHTKVLYVPLSTFIGAPLCKLHLIKLYTLYFAGMVGFEPTTK